MSRRGRRGALLAAIGVASLAVGCGAEDHPNEPRPPIPLQLSAKVDDRKVVVAPDEVGAGLANLTISNQTEEQVQISFTGPTEAVSDPINANGVGAIKLELEPGDYEVADEEALLRPSTLSVGPERPSAQNDLLLP